MDYKVVPFTASIDPIKGTANHAADQLQSLIKDYSLKGWEYVGLESVTTFVKPEVGCFGLQSKPGYTTHRQMAVFKR